MKGKVKKVVLAYSGGLDTSVIIPWLKENYGCQVVTFTANLARRMNWKAWRKRPDAQEPIRSTLRTFGRPL